MADAVWLVLPVALLLVQAGPTLRTWARRVLIPHGRQVALCLFALVGIGVVLKFLLIKGSPAAFGYVYDPYYESVELFYRTGHLPDAADCWRAIRHGAIVLAVCLAIGSWTYIDNAVTKGTLLFANGSAQEGFRARDTPGTGTSTIFDRFAWRTCLR